MDQTGGMLPPLSDILSSARVISIPLRQRFRGIDTREVLLFEGPQGWTEFSPFTEYDEEESSVWLAAAIDFGWNATPAIFRSSVRVNATIPAVGPGLVAGILERFAGCRTVKVKVAEPGQALADDVARVAEVRRLLGPEGRIRIDANGAWNVDEAEHAVHALAVYDLEYVEQPCETVEELADIRKRVKYMGMPIAADESVRRAIDPLEVAAAKAADLLVLKAQPLGGIGRALSIINAAGLPAVISSALETSVGISMGLHLAAAIESLPYDCGLGTVSFFEGDITKDSLVVEEGMLSVRRVTPDPTLLDTWAADADRTAWWLARLERCHATLTNHTTLTEES